MSNKLLTKNWLVYIIINQIIQFTYLLDAFFWYDHILILYFYIIAISLLNSFCYDCWKYIIWKIIKEVQ